MDRHNWYYRFRADVDWLGNFISDIEATDRSIVLALTGTTGVGSGFNVTERGAGANFSVDISSGVGYDPSGRRFYAASTINVPFVEDENSDPIEVVGGGNDRVVSIYAEYSLVDDPGEVAVDGFGDNVFLITTEEVAYRLYQGAEAGAGLATPAAHPGGNLTRLADVTIHDGDVTIQNADIDESEKEYLSLTIGPDSVGFTEIDWGLGANQVSAADVPIEDSAGDFTATDVEAALAELFGEISAVDAAAITDHGALSGLGDDDHSQYALVAGDTFTGTIVANNAVAVDLNTNGNRIDLDADNDTSIRCSADDTIQIEINGSDRITMNATGELLLPDIDPPTANYMNRNSVCKAWGVIQHDGMGGLDIDSSYNLSSISLEATGQYRVTFDRDFSGATDEYTAFGTSFNPVTGVMVTSSGVSTSQCDLYMWNSAGSAVDNSISVVFFGNQ